MTEVVLNLELHGQYIINARIQLVCDYTYTVEIPKGQGIKHILNTEQDTNLLCRLWNIDEAVYIYSQKYLIFERWTCHRCLEPVHWSFHSFPGAAQSAIEEARVHLVPKIGDDVFHLVAEYVRASAENCELWRRVIDGDADKGEKRRKIKEN